MKAVIYARYSSDNQREESIEGQIRECTAYPLKPFGFRIFLFARFCRKQTLPSCNSPNQEYRAAAFFRNSIILPSTGP